MRGSELTAPNDLFEVQAIQKARESRVLLKGLVKRIDWWDTFDSNEMDTSMVDAEARPAVILALESAARGHAAAVLSAVALPDGNWRDLVERMRLQDRAVQVILCAKAVTAELWWDALESGVSDIVVSPYDATELERVLNGTARQEPE